MLATWLQLIDGCEEAWEELDGLFGSFDPPIGGLLHQVASSRESIALARALLDAIDSQQLIVADASEDRSLPTRIHARLAIMTRYRGFASVAFAALNCRPIEGEFAKRKRRS